METTEKVVLLEPNKENISVVFSLINQFAVEKGYEIKGDLKLPSTLFGTNKPSYDSRSKMKVARRYVNQLHKKVTMGQANRFLHFLFKKIYKLETPAPSVEYGEKEQQIRAARKAWRNALKEEQRLQKEYKEIKGDFYKKK